MCASKDRLLRTESVERFTAFISQIDIQMTANIEFDQKQTIAVLGKKKKMNTRSKYLRMYLREAERNTQFTIRWFSLVLVRVREK